MIALCAQGKGPYTNFAAQSIPNTGGDVRGYAGEDERMPQEYMTAPQNNYASINAMGEPVEETPFDYDLTHQPSPNLSYERFHPGCFKGIRATMRKQRAEMSRTGAMHFRSQPRMGNHRRPQLTLTRNLTNSTVNTLFCRRFPA